MSESKPRAIKMKCPCNTEEEVPDVLACSYCRQNFRHYRDFQHHECTPINNEPKFKTTVVQSQCGPIKVESKLNTNIVHEVVLPIPFPSPPVRVEQFALLSPGENEFRENAEPSPTLIAEYLRYVYTSDNKDLETEVTNLFLLEGTPASGEHFRIQALIRACEKSILKGVTLKNVFSYYNCGKKIKSGIITDTCFDYMKANRKEIWKTREEFEKSCKDYPEIMYKLLLD